MEAGEYDALLRSLAGIAAHQAIISTDLRECNRQLVGINATMDATLARMDTTLARMRTLLARILPPGETGADA